MAGPGRGDGQGPARRRGKTGPNPTDRGKQGVKRSLLTDGQGLPLAVALDGANRNDRTLRRDTLQAVPVKRPTPSRRRPQHLCLRATTTPSRASGPSPDLPPAMVRLRVIGGRDEEA